MTFREYTSFGGGTLIMLVLVVDHIEIIRFDKWYDTVMDILKKERR
jgi:hypothetical protein